MLKYQKFQAPISKGNVMPKKGSNVLSYAEAKWKASKKCSHSLVGGHISLDFVPVVYDLIELIIKASPWLMDYSTFDTHPQHARLWFN